MARRVPRRTRYHLAEKPPSTKIICPVRKSLARLARNTATPSKSAGSPLRPIIVRNGEAGDFEGVAVFLASRASDYVTGQVIFVDGGFSAT